MSTFWTKDKIALYVDACNMLNYPEIPLGKYFKEVIRPDDTVMDIGCGPGVVSLYLATLCKSVTAVDPDEFAYESLKKMMSDRKLTNINAVNSKWPNPAIEPCDVAVLLYVFKVLKSSDSVQELLKVTKRSGIILEPINKKSFYKPLYKYLGIEYNDSSDPDEYRTVDLLKAEGAAVRVETISHDFGQPVGNLDDAAQFIWQKLHVGEEYYPKVQGVVEDYTEIREGRLYVPNLRISRLIIFDKKV